MISATISNYTLSRNLITDMKFLGLSGLEALATPETDQTAENSTMRMGCAISEEYIAGYDHGIPIIQTRMVPGESGACLGPKGTCHPYPCTRIY